MMMRRKDGFTLVEMLVTIVCASIVTGAVLSALLFSMKVNRQTLNVARDQNNTRIIGEFMNTMAGNGAIKENSSDGTPVKVVNSKNNPKNTLFLYDTGSKRLLTGGGAKLLENVSAFSVKRMDEKKEDGAEEDDEPKLPVVKYTLEVEGNSYSFEGSVYDRTLNDSETEHLDNIQNRRKIKEKESREALGDTADKQKGSTGSIIGGDDEGKSYTEWFTKAKGIYDEWVNTTEKIEGKYTLATPWCATFVSWVLDKNQDNLIQDDRASVPCFASVAVGVKNFTDKCTNGDNDIVDEDVSVDGWKPNTHLDGDSDKRTQLEIQIDDKDVIKALLEKKTYGTYGNWYGKDWKGPGNIKYTPRVGDLVFFYKKETKEIKQVVTEGTEITYEDTYSIYHVGIINRIDGSDIFFVDGNHKMLNDEIPQSVVQESKLSDYEGNILGYGVLYWDRTPDDTGESAPADDPDTEP